MSFRYLGSILVAAALLALSDGALATGYMVGSGSLMAPADADAWYCAQPAGCTASGTRQLWVDNYPVEITTLAAALRNDPDLIYEYVRNNIEIVPVYGLQKGALGALIDHSGTAFDQAQLMVELLRAAGYSASFVSGTLTLSASQVYNWFGVTDATAIGLILGDGGIPATVTSSSGIVSQVTLSHVWVRTTLNGADYVFDPSFKPHTFTNGIDFAAATGWNETSFMSAAQSGMASGTQSARLDTDVNQTIAVPYVSNVNGSGIQAQLTNYAQNLAAYLRTNGYATKQLDDVIGRQDILPAPPGSVRQTSLPGATIQHVWSGNIPDAYRTKIRIEMLELNNPAVLLTQDLYADEIYGRRVAYYPFATGASWMNDTVQLVVDGVNVGALYTGTNTDPTTQLRRTRRVRLSIDHPYAAVSGTYMDLSGDSAVLRVADFISPVVIVTGFGETGQRLQAKFSSEQVKDRLLPYTLYFNCGPDGCENPDRPEQPAGETTLFSAYAGWLAQHTRMTQIQSRFRSGVAQHHHTLGIATRRSFMTATNPNGIYCANCWSVGQGATTLDIETAASVNSKTGIAADRKALARSLSLTTHTLEALQLEQITASATPASVGHRFGWGTANEAGTRYYLVAQGGNSVDLFPRGPMPYYYASIYGATAQYTASGYRVIASANQFLGPGRSCTASPCTDSQNVIYMERGGALQAFAPDGVSSANVVTDAFGSEYKGGMAGSPPTFEEAYSPDKSADLLKDQFKDRSNDFGVDLATGEFTYSAPEDISAGMGEFPHRLGLRRTFISGEAYSPGMGRGWSHNFDIRISLSTDTAEALGQSSPLAAASTLAAAFVTQQIYATEPASNAALLARWVSAPFVQDWWASQVRFNTVGHKAGSDTKKFVRLPDGSFLPPGSYNPADGSSYWQLTQTGSPTGYGIKWDYSAMSFTLASPSKDVQSFAFWRRRNRDVGQAHNFGPHHGWHISSWNFPGSTSLTFSYVPVDGTTSVDDHLAYVQNSLGRRLNFTFNASSDWESCNVQSVNDNQSRSTTFNCANDTVTNPAAEVTRYVYGTSNCGTGTWPDGTIRPRCSPYLTEVFGPSDSAAPKLRLTYDAVGRVKTYSDAVAVKTPANRVPYQFYLTGGTRGERRDPAGGYFTVYYDAWGRAIQFLDELGRVTSSTYDGLGRIASRVSPEGVTTEFGHDALGNTTLIRRTPKATTPATSPATLSVTATYDAACGKIKTVTDPKSNVTTWTYDPTTCLVSQVQQPTVLNGRTGANAAPVTVYAYTSAGLVDTITDPTGVVTNYDYDASGNRTLVQIDAAGVNARTSYGYDGVGNITSRTTGRGNTANYYYDAARRVVTVQEPLATCAITENIWENGLLKKVRRAKACNPESSTDAQWQVWTKSYTPADQVDVETDPDGGTKDTDYDALDRPEYIRESVGGTAASRVTRTEYDAAGQVSKIYKGWGTPDQILYVQYTYTLDGQQSSIRDANLNVTEFGRDGYGRLARTTWPDGSYESYGYDDNGNVVSKRNRSGITITTAFDALNREISRSVPDNPSYAGSYARTLATTYDLASRKWDATADGQTLRYRYDTAGRPNQVQDSLLNVLGASIGNVEYAYDASSNREAVRFYTAQGSWAAHYDYDAGERLWHVTDGTTTLAQYSYDPLSRVSTTNYLDASSMAATYEADGDLQSLTHYFNGGNLALGYTHNGVHQITGLSVTDSAYLMQQPGPATGYTVNNLNQYSQVGSATLAYDQNGNLLSDGTWTYSYDEENRLRRVVGSGVTADYSYDPAGRRRAKVVNGVTTYYMSDGENELAELSSTGSRLRFYVNALGLDERVAMHDDVSLGWLFYHVNHQGSVLFTSRAQGSGAIQDKYRYGAFGEPFSTDSSTGNPFRYTGRYLDAESSLYYYRARYYSPKLGRFLQTDPIGYEDDVNLYAYVKNDPLNATDPTGLCKDPYGVGCPTQGTPQTTRTPGHDTKSIELMKEMVNDAKAAGETNIKGSFNQRQTGATGGVIDDPRITDATVTSEAKSGQPVVRNGEVTSPSQTMESQGKKLLSLEAKAQKGVKVGSYVKALTKGAGVVGAVVTAGEAAGAVAENPTKDGVKTAAGNIVTEALCGLMGGCGTAE